MSCAVSVLMPVLNGNFVHLSEAIDSILEQTFKDFEFLIVDDGSNLETKEFLASYAARDERIVILTNETNVGVGNSLNRGLEQARGRYVARHDADDIAHTERLAKQFNYMEAHPDIILSCTSVNHIDMQGEYIGGYPVSIDSDLLEAELLLNSRLCHPSLMFRTKEIRDNGGYPVTKSAQDYLLYLKSLKAGYKFGGIDQPLVDYRINTESITRKNRTKQLATAESGSYEHATRLAGQLDRQAFQRFWYFVATQGRTDLKVSDLRTLKPLLSFIKHNRFYYKAWAGSFRYVSRNSLDHVFSLQNLIITLYFRYRFKLSGRE